MPSANKTRWSQLRVGVMAAIALCILGYLIFLMAGSKGLFEKTSTVYTYMEDAANLADGAPVTLNGINVGKVVRTELTGSREPNRTVRVVMEVRAEMLKQIPVDSVASISAANLLGTKYINITKGTSLQTVQPGGEIPSLNTREFEEVVQQGYNAIAGLNLMVAKLNAVVDQIQLGKGSIGKLLVDETLYNRALAIANETQKLMTSLNEAVNSKNSTIGQLLHNDEIYQDTRNLITRVDGILEGIEKGEGTAGKFLKDDAVYKEAQGALTDLRQLLAGLDKGEGTAGKLLKSDELHNQLTATLRRMDAVLDKVNNGKGTIGELMNNPQLYQSLDATSNEIRALLRDFRANPKKFLTVQFKLF
jgi:phospholipid/cholesterol/gamma-HCH transport system substrate-binding protein